MPVSNILIYGLLTAMFLSLFIPLEKPLKKLLNTSVSPLTIAFIILAGATGVFLLTTGITGILYLTLSAFCLWIIAFGFLVNRKYPYLLAMTFLIFCPFLLIANLNKLAEYSAVLCYLCLILGVSKDIVYDKIMDDKNND